MSFICVDFWLIEKKRFLWKILVVVTVQFSDERLHVRRYSVLISVLLAFDSRVKHRNR